MGHTLSKHRRRRRQPAPSELQISEASSTEPISHRLTHSPRPVPDPEPMLERSSQPLEPTAHLHELPTVLQEKILLHSLEPCLARVLAGSSKSLGKELSTEKIYRVFVLLAFFDNEPPLPVKAEHFEPACYQFLSRDARRKLQRDLVQCKWFTWEFFQKHVPALVRLALERECRLHCQAEEARGNNASNLPDVDNVKDLVDVYLDNPFGRLRRQQGLTDMSKGPGLPEEKVVRRSMGPGKHLRRSVVFLCIPSRALNPASWTYQSRQYLGYVASRVEPGSEMDAEAFNQGWDKAVQAKEDIVLLRLNNIQRIARSCCGIRKREIGKPPWLLSIHSTEYINTPLD